jgi:hypothetical protein
MPDLMTLLGAPDRRPAVIDDCCKVLDQEVADKGGLSGVAIKAAFNLLKGVKPGFVREVVDALLDDFLKALDPLYQEAVEGGITPGEHLRSKSDAVAEALLAVTDARIQRAERAVIKKTYDRLRPTAKKHVEAAAPRLGALLDRHTA